jgi:glycerol-3-phosphate acyltransferase PlsY
MSGLDAGLLLIGYLAGALPIGLAIGRLRGVDLRQHGSRNIGATNAGRVLGRPWFFVVFLLDFAKAFGPAVAARRFASGAMAPETLALLVGVAAVLGHVFPVFLGFRGGKGVATAAGAFVAVAPAAAGAAWLAWLLVFLLTRIVSAASLAAAVALPVACFLLPQWRQEVAVGVPVQVAAVSISVLIVARHRANIGRLLRGEEPRAVRRKE